VPKRGLATPFRGRPLLDLAKEVLEISSAGLRARARRDSSGEDETVYLDALREIVAEGRTPAEALLEAHNTRWNRSVDPVYREQAY
jgi:glutamate--cysteine ligase